MFSHPVVGTFGRHRGSTGFYGQNVPYSSFGHLSGSITSRIVMIVLAGGLYWLPRRNAWL
jgi:Mg2+ and Co2+ transporter CorA